MTEIKKFMGQNIINILKVQSTRVDNMDAYMNIELEKFFDSPVAPTVDSITDSSATVTSIAGAEVSLDLSNWYDSPYDFTGLDSNTNYTAYARMKASGGIPASEPSEGTDFQTLELQLGSNIDSYAKQKFVSGQTAYCSLTQLDTNKALCAYQYAQSYDRLSGVIFNVSDTTLSFAGNNVSGLQYSDYVATDTLSSAKAITAYVDNAYDARACIYSISGNSISYGAEHTFHTSSGNVIYSTDVKALSDSKAVVCYRGSSSNSYYGYCQVLDVSGTSITSGSANRFDAYRAYNPTLAKLSSTKFIVFWDTTSQVEARIGNVSDSTISYGTGAVIDSDGEASIGIAAISESKAIVLYTLGASIRTKILNISGNTITPQARYTVEADGVDPNNRIQIVPMTSTKVAVAYRTDGNVLKARMLTIDGTTITVGSVENFKDNGADGLYMAMCRIDDAKLVTAFRDPNASNYGYGILLEVVE